MKASKSLAEGGQVKPGLWEVDLMLGCRLVVRSKAESAQKARAPLHQRLGWVGCSVVKVLPVKPKIKIFSTYLNARWER